MSRKEIAFAKSCALATRDWDTYQAILRRCLKPQPEKSREAGKKTGPARPA